MDKDEIVDSLKNLDIEEAVSYQMHSRIFEILGYLSNISENYLPPEEQEYISRVKQLAKDLLNEMHIILEYYKNEQAQMKKDSYH